MNQAQRNGDASSDHWTLPDGALRYDEWGRLVYTDAVGREYVDAALVRAFPLTAPSEGIAICNAAGHEVLWIDNLNDLPEFTRQFVEDDLSHRSFLPVLKRIIKVTNPIEPTEWHVETDRGPTRFILNSDDDVVRIDEQRAMVIDANGTRYLIPDQSALDSASRRILERYL